MILSENGELNFENIPEVITALRACGDDMVDGDPIISGLGEIYFWAIERNAMPAHSICPNSSELILTALEKYVHRTDIDGWLCAQASYMLTLVTLPEVGLQ